MPFISTALETLRTGMCRNYSTSQVKRLNVGGSWPSSSKRIFARTHGILCFLRHEAVSNSDISVKGRSLLRYWKFFLSTRADARNDSAYTLEGRCVWTWHWEGMYVEHRDKFRVNTGGVSRLRFIIFFMRTTRFLQRVTALRFNNVRRTLFHKMCNG